MLCIIKKRVGRREDDEAFFLLKEVEVLCALLLLQRGTDFFQVLVFQENPFGQLDFFLKHFHQRHLEHRRTAEKLQNAVANEILILDVDTRSNDSFRKAIPERKKNILQSVRRKNTQTSEATVHASHKFPKACWSGLVEDTAQLVKVNHRADRSHEYFEVTEVNIIIPADVDQFVDVHAHGKILETHLFKRSHAIQTQTHLFENKRKNTIVRAL